MTTIASYDNAYGKGYGAMVLRSKAKVARASQCRKATRLTAERAVHYALHCAVLNSVINGLPFDDFKEAWDKR